MSLRAGSARTIKTNRVALAVTGLAAALVGAAGLAASVGLFGVSAEHDPVITISQSTWVDDQSWFWPVIAVGCVLLGALCLYWLAIQFRSDRPSGFHLESDLRHGTSRVRERALATVLAEHVESFDGVRKASALVASTAGLKEADVRLRVSIEPGTDLSVLRREIAEEALPALHQALGVDSIPCHLLFNLA